MAPLLLRAYRCQQRQGQHMKTWQALGAICMVAGFAVTAAPVTLTGADLLSSPNASFPGASQPRLAGSSIYFEWGVSHGPPRMNLVRFQVNSGGSVPQSGDATISATWNVTRLACIGFCAAGDDGTTASDWDPTFYLSDGATMLGFGLSDSHNGILSAFSDTDGGSAGSAPVTHYYEEETGFPAINGSLTVQLDFTLHEVGSTARIRYLGLDRSWTFANTLARSSSLALVLGQDNDSGERYQVNSIQFPDAAEIPEPTSVALVGAALLAIAAARRRKS